MQFLDSDDSSLWSSSTETTNVDERNSLTDFQHGSAAKPEATVHWKKPSRFEIIPCATSATDENDVDDDDDYDDEEGPEVSPPAPGSAEGRLLPAEAAAKPVAHFSLCCGDGVSTVPMLPKKMPLLHPDR
jgi:hypothetical protein